MVMLIVTILLIMSGFVNFLLSFHYIENDSTNTDVAIFHAILSGLSFGAALTILIINAIESC